VVLPSYYREGVPRSLLEAASMGKPVITTDSVGCRDTVEDGVTGWLVPPRNSCALGAQMLSLYDLTDAERAGISASARSRVGLIFDERIVLKAYLNAMQSVVPQNAPGVITA
jgi:glycosyltransferase involved in cell wall biosynthesis